MEAMHKSGMEEEDDGCRVKTRQAKGKDKQQKKIRMEVGDSGNRR